MVSDDTFVQLNIDSIGCAVCGETAIPHTDGFHGMICGNVVGPHEILEIWRVREAAKIAGTIHSIPVKHVVR
jgi:hypothetical protein